MAKFFHEHSCKIAKQDNKNEAYSRNARLVEHRDINQYTSPPLSHKGEKIYD